MTIRVVCRDCTASVRVDTDRAIGTLRALGAYGFGSHVSDSRAFAIRLVWGSGWRHVIRVGKNVITMRCVVHRDRS